MAINVGFARNAARKILNELGIKSAPVYVNQVATHLRLELWEYDKLPEKISALLVEEKKLIVTNSSHHANRKRFSIGHEIGHYVLGHSQRLPSNGAEEIDFLVDYCLRHTYTGEQEAEANEFAAELLMPLEVLKVSFKKQNNPKELAEEFKVSEEAMWIRLCKLKLIRY